MKRLALALPLLLALPRAQAASCQIGATDLAFGPVAYNAPAPIDGTATVSIHSCVDDGSGDDVSYSITLGTGVSNTYTFRLLDGPASQLHYNVFADPGHMTVWGDGSDGSVTVSGSFTVAPGSTSAEHVAYGRIPSHQTGMEPGLYTDSLLVTIDY